MGGRGASSGISDKGVPYGREYTSVLKSSNIKFVKKNDGSASAPLETMTRGRVYVTVTQDDKLKSITYYDNHNKRFKQIDLDHYHKINGNPEKPHTQYGIIITAKLLFLRRKSKE
jgi:hypothetical protein